MNENRTLERCGKPAGMAGRPCMRVAGHIGTCIPAMLDDDELEQLKAESIARHPANMFPIDANSAYGKMSPVFTRSRIPAVYLVFASSVFLFLLLQLVIDGYVIAKFFTK